MSDQLAPDAQIEQLVALLQAPDTDDVAAIDAALARYPEDPRLHFMRGSVLAERSEHIKAHAALTRAVELAPDFAVARYQLGFFELTSGEADQALSTWGPLLRGPRDNYLRVFVEGMVHVIRDEFPEAIATFERGIALNQENPPMNGDIQLLIRELRIKMDENTGLRPGDGDGEETSASALLLRQFGGNRTIN
jgi:tetratricopeptide (TPR) repeat protein